MKKIILMLCVILSNHLYAQIAEIAPNIKNQTTNTPYAVGAVCTPKFVYDLVNTVNPTVGYAGIYYVNDEFLVSKWASDSIIRISKTGVLLEKIKLPITGVRSITWDGTHFWFTNNTTTLHRYNLTTRTVVSTITVPMLTRFATYDSNGSGGFWIGNFGTDLVKVNMSGSAISTISFATHTFSGIYGLALDRQTLGGPYLHCFRQEGANYSTLSTLRLSDNANTANIDVFSTVSAGTTLVSSIAGGLFFASYNSQNVIGGILQGTPNNVIFGIPTSCLVPTCSSVPTPTGTITWTGDVSTDWNVACNWSPASVPSSGNNVLIPSGLSNYPILDINTSVVSVIVQPNASLTINASKTLTLLGDGTNYALENFGTINNNGTISISTTVDAVQFTDNSLFNNNAGAVFTVTTTGNNAIKFLSNAILDNKGIVNASATSTSVLISATNTPTEMVKNYGTMNLSGQIEKYTDIIHNYPCGKIYLTIGDLYNNGGSFNNEGLISIVNNLNDNAGTFTNNGVIKLIGSGIFTNNKTRVNENSTTSSIFTFGGSNDMVVDGIFTNLAANASAGTYVQATNIFTPNALPGGVQTLYAKITGGACVYVVPFTFNNTTVCSEVATPTGVITWNGSVSTDWNIACNWLPASVPSSGNDVIIPSGLSNYPILDINTSVVSVNVQDAASLTVNTSKTLTILGDGTNFALENLGTINNDGTISLSTTVDAVHLSGNSLFNNNVGAVFTVNTAGSNAIRMFGDAVLDNKGIVNFTASSASIFIYTSNTPIENIKNYGTMNLSGQLEKYADIFHNYPCGKIYLNVGDLYNNGGSFNNEGYIFIANNLNDNASTFTNNGVIKLDGSGTFTNNNVRVNNNSSAIFTYGGSFNMTVDGIFSDASASTLAGTFTAPNTFVPLGSLPAGLQTLYAKITSGACVYIVPFTFNNIICQTPFIDFYEERICSGETVSLFAYCPDGSAMWYTTATGGVSISTGLFLTPALTVNTTYYVSCKTDFCESVRTPINIAINPPAPARLYVNVAAEGANTGLSWADAFTDLQSALNYFCFDSSTEIWVAKGTYYPTATTNRAIFFKMQNNMSIYGGFSGNGTETLLSQRDFKNNATILSGDIDKNDGANFANNDNNSQNIVVFTRTNNTPILDGFSISGANSNATGGVQMESSSPIIRNCIITGNKGIAGGGMGVFNSNPTITNCSFIGNQTPTANGGGLLLSNSSPTITNCTFLGNFASNAGAIMMANSSPTLTNCSISGNHANFNGGAIFIQIESNPIIKNSIIWGNSSELYNDNSQAISTFTFINTLVKGQSTGTGVFDGTQDPLFVSQPSIGLGTSGNLRLTACSPALNVGDNTGISGKDLDGNPRIFNTTVDLGAYELQEIGNAATATNTGPYQLGETISLSASGGENYSWSGPNNFTSSLANPMIINALAINGGIYSVTVSTGICTATATTNVIINSGIDPCVQIMEYSYVLAGNPYQTLFPLTNGANIAQNVNPTSILVRPICNTVTIESVDMTITGASLNWTILQNVEPFALFDNTGNFVNGQVLAPGTYSLTITGYAGDNRTGGTTYGPIVTTFTIVGNTPTISMPTFTGTEFCAGTSLNVSFTTTGTFAGGNQFNILLSNENGSFASPQIIGSTNIAGSVLCTIPNNVLGGENYRIKVVSTDPAASGNYNLVPLTINPIVYNLVSPTNDFSVGTANKQAVETINARNNITGASRINYKAGNSIVLTPGFQVVSHPGSSFKAEIAGCSN